MRAVQINRFGTPDVLDVVDAPEPEPGTGDVLVRTVATSINPVDDKTREGAIGEGTPPLPMTLGWDLAGIVVDGGSSGMRAGERVIAMSHQLGSGRGAWADLVALPARAVAPAARTVSLAEAATLPLPGLTAWQTLDWLAVKAGERLLIAGAAGAVGGLALQIARARGVKVDALVSRDAQVAFAHEHGADLVTTDRRALQDRSYDAVFDTFGAFVTEAVADGGRYASIATQAGPVPDVSSRGVRTTVNQVREDGAGLNELTKLVDSGSLRLRVHSTFGLSEIQAAHERFLRGSLAGKITVIF
ncbi:NADP-dependent oxidoreductase [Streptomyces sp. NBC_01218]|uniref:NADP-dependent oxidoreductase n=1 Tax=unclassified Streptomyces TaxID=2593676 RepID=UPI0023B940AA|nr:MULTISPECIES: NADP-dependent oxidoreductase [unclassified Streptomyces]WEH39641.1 NADP-dependent oxidoreductase [Streptomyces sp. AM 2-1-1]WSQ51332.1 NADP-dependent oxidoreductase [Streptomyces sp. NBC_01218]